MDLSSASRCLGLQQLGALTETDIQRAFRAVSSAAGSVGAMNTPV